MNYKQLQAELPKLKGWREKAFVLCLAQRNLPNYELFAEVAGHGSAPRLASIVRTCWDMVESNQAPGDKVDSLIRQLESLFLDEDDFDIYGVYPASKCLKLVEHVLYSWVNPENRRAHTAASISLAVVTEFIEYSAEDDVDEDELVRLFEQDPLVRQEQAFQTEVYQLLKQARHPSAELFSRLKALSANDGVSNIGICLE